MLVRQHNNCPWVVPCRITWDLLGHHRLGWCRVKRSWIEYRREEYLKACSNSYNIHWKFDSVYRQKERIFWNLRSAEQTGQPRELWQLSRSWGQKTDRPCQRLYQTVRQLLDYFNEKIASVPRWTGGYLARSSPMPTTATLDEFTECSEEYIKTILMSRQSNDTNSTRFQLIILPFMITCSWILIERLHCDKESFHPFSVMRSSCPE